MRNSILIGVMLSCMVLGSIIGAGIQQHRDKLEIEHAWDDITVVADGTLVANPSDYAYEPWTLAEARNVRIVKNREAAIEVANRAVVDTAFGPN